MITIFSLCIQTDRSEQTDKMLRKLQLIQHFLDNMAGSKMGECDFRTIIIKN